MNTSLISSPAVANTATPLVRSMNADIVSRTLQAQRQQQAAAGTARTLAAPASKEFVCNPDGSLTLRGEWQPNAFEGYLS